MKKIVKIIWNYVCTDNRDYEDWLYKLKVIDNEGEIYTYKTQSDFFKSLNLNTSINFNYKEFCDFVKEFNKDIEIEIYEFNVS